MESNRDIAKEMAGIANNAIAKNHQTTISHNEQKYGNAVLELVKGNGAEQKEMNESQLQSQKEALAASLKESQDREAKLMEFAIHITGKKKK